MAELLQLWLIGTPVAEPAGEVERPNEPIADQFPGRPAEEADDSSPDIKLPDDLTPVPDFPEKEDPETAPEESEGQTEAASEIGEEETEETVEETAQPEPIGFGTLFTSRAGFWGLWLVLIAAALATAVCLVLPRLLKKRGGKLPAKGVQIGKLHEQGAREYQQDCFATSPVEAIGTHGLLAVVADGMGGLEDGDLVSQTTVGAVLDGFMQLPGAPFEPLLWTMLRQANSAVNRFLGPDKLRKSGSTLVAGILREGKFQWISVGDSRIYLWRDGVLTQLSREHIFLNELALRYVNNNGTLDEAYQHPRSDGLTSYLGQGELKHADIPTGPIEVFADDVLLMMSDGVYNALSQEELIRCLQGSADQMAKTLGAAIAKKNHPKQDNYTAVVLKLQAAGNGKK